MLTSVLAVGVWTLVTALVVLSLRLLKEVSVPPPESSDGKASVSVVVTAYNEAPRVGAFLGSLLSQDHPDFEVVLVDDRSKDGTIDAAELAVKHDPRVRIVRIESRPVGWQGRLYAQSVGAAHATGEWLLFLSADQWLADVQFLRAMVAEYERRDVAAISVIGPFVGSHWWDLWWFRPIMNNPILWGVIFLFWRLRPDAVWLIGAPAMRRSTYEAIGGAPAAALCGAGVYDDWGWARAFKRRGAHTAIVYHPALHDRTNWENFRDFWEGMIRWTVGIFTYRRGGWVTAAAVAAAIVLVMLSVLRFIFDLITLQIPTLSTIALAAVAPTIGFGYCRWDHRRNRFAWLMFLVGLPILAVLTGSAWARLRNRVWWRGEKLLVVANPPAASRPNSNTGDEVCG